jgi:hypothetical protein
MTGAACVSDVVDAREHLGRGAERPAYPLALDVGDELGRHARESQLLGHGSCHASAAPGAHARAGTGDRGFLDVIVADVVVAVGRDITPVRS